MKKTYVFKIAAIACFLSVSAVLSAGGKKDSVSPDRNQASSAETEDSTVPSGHPAVSADSLRVGSLNGPTGIPLAYLYENHPDLGGVETVFQSYASPAALLPKMIKGEVDIGFLPANVAAKVYLKNNGAIVAAGITGNGNVVLVTEDPGIASLADLKGKTVEVAGQGATPDYMFRYLLSKNGIAVGTGDNMVQPDYSIETSRIGAELISGKIRYAVVPEPFATVVTMRDKNFIRAINFQTEYEKIEGAGQTYPLTLMVVRAGYAAEHPETVRAFIAAYRKSTEWTITNPNKAGVLVQKYTLGLMAPIVARAIPNSQYVFIDAVSGRASIEKLLDIFLQFAPESVGGVLPDDGFYFK
jgi:NitT/TauT family transport system substrate-binding protein